MQATRKLYYEDAQCRSFCAKLLACEPIENGLFRAALEATAFYPEGGGQPSDKGALGGARVVDVQEQNSIVWHILTTPLRALETVQGDIDWVRRLDLMQQHTGEHIFSGILSAQYGCNNVGFHIGEDAVRVDLDKPLTAEELQAAEDATNWVICGGAPVDVLWPDVQALQTLNYRSKKEPMGPLRIVRAGGADTCACCGLHVQRCSEIGALKIISAQSYKGGTRVLLVCGMRALKDYTVKFRNISEISVLLSAKPEEAAQAVARLQKESQSLKARCSALEQALFAQKAQALAAQNADKLVCFEPQLSGESLRHLCGALCEAASAKGICMAFSQKENGFAYALGSRETDVRPLGKILNETCMGSGGGKVGFVQGTVSCSLEALEAFCIGLL